VNDDRQREVYGLVALMRATVCYPDLHWPAQVEKTMFEMMFDPVGLLLEVANEMYPKHSARIFWTNDLVNERGEGVTGLTIRKPGEPPTVIISLDIPLHDAVETVAHELAHVIVGKEVHEHDGEWYGIFQALNRAYVSSVQRAASGHGNVEVVNVAEEHAKEKGFRDMGEMNEMVALLPVTEPGVVDALRAWQENDGTKAGLQKLQDVCTQENAKSFDEAARENGFANEAELFAMIAKVDMTAPGAILLFRNWQNNDGSKEGLQDVINTCRQDAE